MVLVRRHSSLKNQWRTIDLVLSVKLLTLVQGWMGKVLYWPLLMKATDTISNAMSWSLWIAGLYLRHVSSYIDGAVKHKTLSVHGCKREGETIFMVTSGTLLFVATLMFLEEAIVMAQLRPSISMTSRLPLQETLPLTSNRKRAHAWPRFCDLQLVGSSQGPKRVLSLTETTFKMNPETISCSCWGC